MELRHLRYFDAVATTQNFTRAAEVLGVAQPPLSRQIRELETEMGVDLFDRSARPVRLTEAGRIFHAQAVQILAGAEQLRRSMRRLQSAGRRRYVIGIVGSIVYGSMPEMIRRFRAQAPHIDVQLLEMLTLEQVAALKEGRIDVGLGRIRIDDPAIRREVLYEEPLIVALAASHALAGDAAPVQLADLSRDRLIVYPSQPRPSYADQVLTLFRDHGLQPEEVDEVREVQTALGLVAAEAGIAIVPGSMRHLQRDDIVYRVLAETDAVSPIILSHRIGDVSAETRLFEQIGRASFG